MSKQYETIIGLEIHVQLKTKSKMFSYAENVLGEAEPNTAIDPVVMGHPGTLPVLNKEAVLQGMRLALALNCDIAHETRFDRKNYFYPDLPKGYQISQFDKPLAENGTVSIFIDGEKRELHLERLHLEEDAGKNIHKKGRSLVDFNRAGTPLAEIVTKADLRSPEEARMFLQELRLIARYVGVSDADMEKGQLRCDANISLRPMGEDRLYPKTEIKNINSFKAVERALQYEVERQKKLWDKGNPPEGQETRGWNEDTGETVSQRTKEGSDDYRYFPEPDVPQLQISPSDISEVQHSLPELPQKKRIRFADSFGLSVSDASLLVDSGKRVAEFFENTISECKQWLPEIQGKDQDNWEESAGRAIKLAHSWITGELFKHMKSNNHAVDDLKITPENMAEFLALVYEAKVNSSAAQTILDEMYRTGGDPSDIAEEKNLYQTSDEDEILNIVKKVITEFPDQVSEYTGGKEGVLQFLIGQVMKASQGKANPAVVSDLLKKELS